MKKVLVKMRAQMCQARHPRGRARSPQPVWTGLQCALVFVALPACARGIDEVVWEVNRNWAPSATTYFDGAECYVEAGTPCPRDMGWQGNELTWSFLVEEGGLQAPFVRFELAVDRVVEPIEIEVAAGPEGSALPLAGVLAIDGAGMYGLRIASDAFREGRRNRLVLSGSNEAGYGEPSGVRWRCAGLYLDDPSPPAVDDGELLDDTEWRACRYFWEQALPGGLVLDTAGSDVSSIAAVGFGASAMTILAERAGSRPRWTVSATAARERAGALVDAVLEIQSRQDGAEDEWGRAGIPYHFVDAEGRRARQCEVSTVDGALMLSGLLQAGEYFGGTIRQKALEVFRNVDLKAFYRPESNQYSHGWTPERGLISQTWDRPTDETLLVCLLSLAANPDDPDRLRACFGYPRAVEEYAGVPVVRSYFGSLFTYTFAHFWIPFECLGRDRPDLAGIDDAPAVDWWRNSRQAVEANRRYHRARSGDFPSLSAVTWGASACYRADRVAYFGTNGAEPAEVSSGARFDGTVPPHGATMCLDLARASGGEVPAENPAFQALRDYYDTRRRPLWCSYGPRSSFDHLGHTSVIVVGIEKGPEALGIEAYRSGMIASTFANHPAIAAALARVFEKNDCPPRPREFTRGHVNDDSELDLSDPVFLLEHLYGGGPPPVCEDAADANDDGLVDLSDAVTLLYFLYLGEAPPPPPFPYRGFDLTADPLEPCMR